MADKTISQVAAEASGPVALADVTNNMAVPAGNLGDGQDHVVLMSVVKQFCNQGQVASPATIGDGTGTGAVTIDVLAANTDYKYGELSSLTITALEASQLASSVKFTSGATPTTINLPASMKWAGGETPTVCEASRIYLITVCDGIGVFTDLGSAN